MIVCIDLNSLFPIVFRKRDTTMIQMIAEEDKSSSGNLFEELVEVATSLPRKFNPDFSKPIITEFYITSKDHKRQVEDISYFYRPNGKSFFEILASKSGEDFVSLVFNKLVFLGYANMKAEYFIDWLTGELFSTKTYKSVCKLILETDLSTKSFIFVKNRTSIVIHVSKGRKVLQWAKERLTTYNLNTLVAQHLKAKNITIQTITPIYIETDFKGYTTSRPTHVTLDKNIYNILNDGIPEELTNYFKDFLSYTRLSPLNVDELLSHNIAIKAYDHTFIKVNRVSFGCHLEAVVNIKKAIEQAARIWGSEITSDIRRVKALVYPILSSIYSVVGLSTDLPYILIIDEAHRNGWRYAVQSFQLKSKVQNDWAVLLSYLSHNLALCLREPVPIYATLSGKRIGFQVAKRGIALKSMICESRV